MANMRDDRPFEPESDHWKDHEVAKLERPLTPDNAIMSTGLHVAKEIISSPVAMGEDGRLHFVSPTKDEKRPYRSGPRHLAIPRTVLEPAIDDDKKH
jgi:hypothetical protein